MRTRRFFVPAGVVGLIALGTAVPHLAPASAATPDLPSITPSQLLVKAEQAKVAGFSGTVKWTPDLGLPDVSALTGGDGQSLSSGDFDPTSLLTSAASFKVWDAGSTEQRLALAPSSLSEVDVVRNGTQLWTSDSSTQRVTHYVAAGHTTPAAPAGIPPTPEQAAQHLLSSVTPTTVVTVVTPVYVAGRPTYELRLAPRAADSTVQSVTIAVDASTGMALRVQVTPKGSTTPALSLGYTSISYAVPAASTFAPLVGTSEVTRTIGGRSDGHRFGTHRPGTHPAGSSRPGAHSFAGHPFGAHRHGFGPGIGRGVTTTGTGWGTIAVLTTRPLSGAAAKELDDVSTAVKLANGASARLVTTRMLDAVVLPDGRIYAGFVTPAAVEAAASVGSATPAVAAASGWSGYAPLVG